MMVLGLTVANLPFAASAAAAGPVAGPAGPALAGRAAAGGQKVCKVTDARLRELSGLVATKTGYIVINDGTEIANRKRVFFLDAKCKVTKAVEYSGNGPRDTEDLALSADGKTLWIADIGDNATSSDRRTSVALWSMPADGSKKPVLHRLSYPERKPRDAEALLMADDGTPIIITKTTGKAEVFTPTAALKTDNTDPVPMKKAGEVTLPKTTTENPLQAAGRLAITGATRSADGSKVVLRTYSDAFEYDVAGGDIVKAITTGTPRVTALADPFGEAIAYSADGASYVTVSDAGTLGDEAEVNILTYQPTTATAPVNVEATAGKSGSKGSFLGSLTLQDITYLIGAVGLLGAILVGVGIFGIMRARKRRAEEPGEDDRSTGAAAGSAPPPPVTPARGGAAPARGGPENSGGWGRPEDSGGWGQPGARPANHPEPGGAGRPAGAGRPGGGGVYGGGKPAGGVYGGGGATRPAGGVYGGGQPRDQGGGPGGNVYGGGGPRGRYHDEGPVNGRPPGGPQGDRGGPRRQPPPGRGGYDDEYR
ncbi:hypothetical protein GCM10027605_20480 [Micromonospora zhanjiangensis]